MAVLTQGERAAVLLVACVGILLPLGWVGPQVVPAQEVHNLDPQPVTEFENVTGTIARELHTDWSPPSSRLEASVHVQVLATVRTVLRAPDGQGVPVGLLGTLYAGPQRIDEMSYFAVTDRSGNPVFVLRGDVEPGNASTILLRLDLSLVAQQPAPANWTWSASLVSYTVEYTTTISGVPLAQKVALWSIPAGIIAAMLLGLYLRMRRPVQHRPPPKRKS